MTADILTPFPCDGCGKCCSNVHLSTITEFLDRGDGICRHLDMTTKRCSIYNERPDICRVELQYRMNYSDKYSWDEFVNINLIVCRNLPD